VHAAFIGYYNEKGSDIAEAKFGRSKEVKNVVQCMDHCKQV